jgi:hypothetical protein
MNDPNSEEQCGNCRHHEEDRTCFLDKDINCGVGAPGFESATPEPIRHSPSDPGCEYFEPRID